jgi:peptidoglycan hydrolase-like protein with peptidoglycan-binding domain
VGELVFWMQRRLADLGYFHGPVNGRAGSETRRAILAYQRAAHLTPTGRINEALVVSLRRAPANPVASRSSR